MNFRIKEKLMLWISGSKKNLFQRNKLAQRWSFDSIYEAGAAHEMKKEVVQLYIKNNEVIFSLAWNIIFSDNWKVLVLKFLEMKNMVFLSQKVDENMIFTDYWKVLVLKFPGMGNTVLFWSKKLAICKSWNGEWGNGIRGRMRTRGIRVGTRGVRMWTRRIRVET